MAKTNKSKDEVIEAEVSEPKQIDATGEELVPLTIPLTYDPKQDAYGEFYSINGKNYLIKRGETVMVPKAIADRYREIQEAQAAAYRFSQKKSLDNAAREFYQQYGVQP